MTPGAGATVGPADERPHRPGPDPEWEESWYFDFVAHDGSLGGFVRLALRPHEATAWYWAYLAGPRRSVVVVRDHELDLPHGRALEVRGPGLWAQVTCETPLDHWSMGLEASGVALDDPAEALRGERGQPVPLGLDLEWEATGKPGPDGALGPGGYAQPATVHGEVLLGSQRIDVDARGWWSHAWGAPRWQDDAWWWAAGNFDDGTAVVAGPGRGWQWSAGVAPTQGPAGVAPTQGPACVAPTQGSASGDGGASELGPGLTLSRSGAAPTSTATLTGGAAEVTLAPAAWAVVPVPGTGGLARSLCAWSAAEKRGWGWCEWLQPPTA